MVNMGITTAVKIFPSHCTYRHERNPICFLVDATEVAVLTDEARVLTFNSQNQGAAEAQ